jgi:hypothetical protein
MVNEFVEALATGIEPLDLLDREMRVDGVLSSEPSLAVGAVWHEPFHALAELSGQENYRSSACILFLEFFQFSFHQVIHLALQQAE